jgi:hypothetical protein
MPPSRSTSRLLRQAAANAQPVKDSSRDFAPSGKFKRENDSLRNEMLRQRLLHRNQLLRYVKRMATWSFVFLAVVVISQMIVRFWKPGYVGASDTVINIITIGVFGQVIGIVASMVAMVFRDSASEATK